MSEQLIDLEILLAPLASGKHVPRNGRILDTEAAGDVRLHPSAHLLAKGALLFGVLEPHSPACFLLAAAIALASSPPRLFPEVRSFCACAK